MVDDEQPVRFSGSARKQAGPEQQQQQQQQQGSQQALVPHPNPAPQAAAAARPQATVRARQVPESIIGNAALAAAMSVLPANYNFEIHKTVWRIQQAGAKQVALQFPEGLLMYACTIADILQEFAGVEHCYVMGDVTYGACCIDDYSAAALGAQLLVHYGHSCLVPVDHTTIPCLYVFVDIAIDVDHLVDTIRLNFPAGTAQQQQQQEALTPLAPQAEQQQQQTQLSGRQQQQAPRLVLAGTIQFSSAIQLAKQRLAADYPHLTIPKVAPLSPGEVLGCTAPVLAPDAADVLVFVADGRFHLEAIMIANPWLPAYRYDPYNRVLTLESYDQVGMRAARRKAIEAAAGARNWGLVLGTLGRQGNPRTAEMLQQRLTESGGTVTTVLLSELSPAKLAAIEGVDTWVQVACPRLSIDWGEGFMKPTLTPFEAMIALGLVPGWWEQEEAAAAAAAACGSNGGSSGGSSGSSGGTCCVAGGCQRVGQYPMDYYARGGGDWNSSYHKPKPAAGARGAAGGGAELTPPVGVVAQ